MHAELKGRNGSYPALFVTLNRTSKAAPLHDATYGTRMDEVSARNPTGENEV